MLSGRQGIGKKYYKIEMADYVGICYNIEGRN